MDKAQALQKIPANLHNVATGLEGCGYGWESIVALLSQIAPVVADWFKANQNKMKAASQGVACPVELQEQLTAARDSAAETLCACCCACHCADCD